MAFKFIPDDWLAQLKAAYPKRSRGKNYCWPKAAEYLEGGLLKKWGFEVILQGTKDFCEASKISGDYGTKFIPMASTFYNQKRFLDEYETEGTNETHNRRSFDSKLATLRKSAGLDAT